MRQLPFRPGNEITQSFNDGLVAIYTVTDGAQPGRLPVPVLEKKLTLRYEERQLGIQRYYSARQNQVKIERVVRVPRTGRVSSQDVAVTEDGRQYRVDWVQSVRDVYPPSVDLTLAAVEQGYKLPGEGVLMTWNDRIIAAHLAVTQAVSHAARMKSERYFVWQEDGSNDLEANGIHQERAVTGSTDLFTKIEFDPWAEALGKSFDRSGIAWRYLGADYEDETGFFHHTWDWEVC